MAVVLASSSAHSSSHLFRPHRAAFHQHRGSFEAFAPHHHSSGNSRSAAASWRHSELQPAAVPVDGPSSPKYRRSGPSHSRTPSTSSEASSTSWRSHVCSPAVTRVDVTGEPSGPRDLKTSSPFVYSVGELLQLSGSPLVGISKESQDIVDDLVAHYVWRRGAQSGTPRVGRRGNNRGTSKPRSLTSTDDSEHSD